MYAGVVAMALVLTVAGVVSAQTGTVTPQPVLQFFANDGTPLSGCLLDTWAAGTTTPQSTFTDSTLGVANANPVVCDPYGRVTVFLSPTTYKFRLRTSAGVTLWTVDNVSATLAASANLQVAGTAGEALTASDVVYLADGTGGTTAGRWYKTDADAAASSVSAGLVGVAAAAINSGSSGAIRLVGRVTGLAGLAPGAPYYISGTAGAITATAPINRRTIGTADSTTTLVLSANPLDTSALADTWSPNGTENALAKGASGRSSLIVVTPASHSTLNGISSTGIVAGTRITLFFSDIAGNTLTITGDSGSATAANRLRLQNGVTSIALSGYAAITFEYSETAAHWIEISNTASGPRIAVFRGTSGQTVSTGVATKVLFNTEFADYFSEYDNLTNFRFTAREAMWVHAQGNVYIAAVSGLVKVYIYKNGIELKRSTGYGNATDVGVPIVLDTELARGDYLEVFVEHAHGSDRTVSSGNSVTDFQVTRIR